LFISSGKGWWNIRIEDNIKLGCTLVSGHPSPTSNRDYVLTLDSKSSLSHAEIQQVTQTVQEDYKSDRLVFVNMNFHILLSPLRMFSGGGGVGVT